MTTAETIPDFHWHVGRSWVGHTIEDDCPCGKAECGLVDMQRVDPACPQHALSAYQTMRQIHDPSSCPACD